MSVSDPAEKIEWGADCEPRKNERVPSSAIYISVSANNGSFCLPNLKYFGIMRKPLKNYTEMNRFGADKIYFRDLKK
jgi:hypothetical protein